MPNSWFGKQAFASQACVVYCLTRTGHAACYLGIRHQPIQVEAFLPETFIGPSHYNYCYKAPDHKYWKPATVTEIIVHEEMRCWW